MTGHDRRLSLVVDRQDDAREDPDREVLPGAALKFSACLCDDGAHGFADRVGWVATADDAHDDWLRTDPERAHIVMRFTAEVADARDLIVRALARAAGEEGQPMVWQETLYGRTADVLVEMMTGAGR